MGEQVVAALNGGIAQLGEHLPCKQGVKGSNPFISTLALRGTATRLQTDTKTGNLFTGFCGWMKETAFTECRDEQRSCESRGEDERRKPQHSSSYFRL